MHDDQFAQCDALTIANPFVHRLKLSVMDKIQIALMTLTVFPIRVFMMLVCLLLMWIIALMAMFGQSNIQNKPMTGWRRKLAVVFKALLRGVLFSCSYHTIHVIHSDKLSTKTRIVVAAPHTTFFDAVVMSACEECPTGVSRIENGGLPFLGKILQFLQPVFVSREDPNSRQKTITELKRRATSDENWPEIVIFPEGTCSNGRCLMSFKLGAFLPGQPIQPVCIRHYNRMNTTFWTWDGPGAYTVMWLTLCQFSSTAVIEVLPIYTPNAQEIDDPKLFAANVRNTVAKHLQVPVTDHSFEDCQLMRYTSKLGLSSVSSLVEFQKLLRILGIRSNQLKCWLEKCSNIVTVDGKYRITFEEFSTCLGLSVTDTLQQLFDLYDQNNVGTIDLREYLIGLSIISQSANTEDILQLAFQLFDRGIKGCLTKFEFTEMLHCAIGMKQAETIDLFDKINTDKDDDKISFFEFKAYAEKKPQFAPFFWTYQYLMNLDTKQTRKNLDKGDIKTHNKKSL